MLVRQLDAFLAELNGETNAFYSEFNKPDSLTYAVVVHLGDRPVGCGALRALSDNSVEIKRMYVEPVARSCGVGKVLLRSLEELALERRFTVARLETSRRLDHAIGLYSGAGYRPIPNYEPYVSAEDSICFEKRLSGG